MKNLTRIEAAYIVANKIYKRIQFYLDLNIPKFKENISEEIDIIKYIDGSMNMRYLIHDVCYFRSKEQLINKIKHSDNINEYLKSVSTS